MGYTKYKKYGTTIHVYSFDPSQERFAYEYGEWDKLERLHLIPRPKKDEVVASIVNFNFFDWTGKSNNGYGEIEQDGVQIKKPSVDFPSFSFKDNKMVFADLPNAQIGASIGLTLILDGKIDIRNTHIVTSGNSKNARTATGQKKNGDVILCVAEGNASKKIGVTAKELASFLLELGCVISFMGDCGGSSSMMVDGKYVYDQGRAIACALVVYKKRDTKNIMQVVVSSSLNIRSSPSIWGRVVGKYSNNTLVYVLDEKDGWVKTDKGWVSKKYLVKV